MDTAFDDQTSTFIIPSGAGFEVVFCPGARSTTILSTNMTQMVQLAQSGNVDHQAALAMRRSGNDMVRRSASTIHFQVDYTLLATTVLLAVMDMFP